MNELKNRKIVVLVGDHYEDQELWYPAYRIQEAGGQAILAGLEAGVTYRSKHGYPAPSQAAVAKLKARDFAGVVVPGGWMPDKLRRDPKVLQLVRDFHQQGKLIAAICHGGWIPISAGVYRGVNVTGTPAIKDDLVNAGALWHDEPLVVDRHFVCSRRPADLPWFCQGMLQVLTGR